MEASGFLDNGIFGSVESSLNLCFQSCVLCWQSCVVTWFFLLLGKTGSHLVYSHLNGSYHVKMIFLLRAFEII